MKYKFYRCHDCDISFRVNEPDDFEKPKARRYCPVCGDCINVKRSYSEKKDWTPKDINILIRMWDEEYLTKEIAYELKRTELAVTRKINKLRNNGVQLEKRKESGPKRRK